MVEGPFEHSSAWVQQANYYRDYLEKQIKSGVFCIVESGS
jgi:hypothetical protein